MSFGIWYLSDGFLDVWVALPLREPRAQRLVRIQAGMAAERVPVWFAGEEGPRAALAEICRALGEPTRSSHLAVSDMHAIVARGLADGRLVAWNSERSLVRIRLEEPVDVVPPELAPAEEAELTWVGIRLMDDDNPPAPVPHVRYEIELPDGTIRTGTLDGAGMARVDGVQPGTAKVRFPDLDPRAWSKA